LREGRDMKPITFANLVSTALYEKRFGPYFVTPIVAGLENGVPIICSYDSIGAMDLDKFAGLK
jgi:20S proteasome subunit beta 3